MDYEEFCKSTYLNIFNDEYSSIKTKDPKKKEREAQKTAIRETTVAALREYQSIEAADIWKAVYAAHLYRKSGLDIPIEQVMQVVSAENSWVKSSGHAFEEIIKNLANEALNRHSIKAYLQKDLNMLIKKGQISNEVRDVSWLREQIAASSFDLYLAAQKDGERYIFSCMQTKTSIRDRVTRDREPSAMAMDAFFWSVAIVLDGDFLRLPKFVEMVNGGGSSYAHNGWHGLYVFSEKYTKDRIYPTNIELEVFSNHAVEAADYWLSQRQWFDKNWRPKKVV